MTQDNNSIIKQSELLYNAKLNKENTIGNSKNMIYEMISDVPIIVRVSEYDEKKEEHIKFELEWMRYLSGKMSNIAKPITIPSAVKNSNSDIYELITCEEKYIVCAFEKASGHMVTPDNVSEYNESLFYDLGVVMGRMHKLTQDYTEADEKINESFMWYNGWNFWPEYNQVIDPEVYSFEEKYRKNLLSLPKIKDSFGIIHGDIQWANFFVDSTKVEPQKITLFDFDDCEYNWYAQDIAITLYQFVQQSGIRNSEERKEFAELFLLSFLKGYVQENSITPYWIFQFDMFMKYRRTTTYKFVQNHFKDEAVNPHEEYLNWLKQGILMDTPFVEVNYDKIVNSISEIK